MSRAKIEKHKGKVLFIDASREFQNGINQNSLRDEDIQKIVAAFKGGKDIERYTRVVSLDQIEKNDWNLNISRYVDTTEAAEKVDVKAALAKLRELGVGVKPRQR